MSGLVAAVKDEVGEECLTGAIKRGKCRIDLTDAPKPHVVVDFDKPGALLGQSNSRPDFLFVSDTGGRTNGAEGRDPGRISPIEISKGKSKSAGHIGRQLQAGVDWLRDILDSQFEPTLSPVYCGSLNKHAQLELRKKKILFRGQSVLPKVVACGMELP